MQAISPHPNCFRHCPVRHYFIQCILSEHYSLFALLKSEEDARLSIDLTTYAKADFAFLLDDLAISKVKNDLTIISRLSIALDVCFHHFSAEIRK